MPAAAEGQLLPARAACVLRPAAQKCVLRPAAQKDDACLGRPLCPDREAGHWAEEKSGSGSTKASTIPRNAIAALFFLIILLVLGHGSSTSFALACQIMRDQTV